MYCICTATVLSMYCICTATSQADVIQQRDRIQAEFNTLEDRWGKGEGEAGCSGLEDRWTQGRAGGQVDPGGEGERAAAD